MIRKTNGATIYLRKSTNIRENMTPTVFCLNVVVYILPFFQNSFESDGQVLRAGTRLSQHQPEEEKCTLKLCYRRFPLITYAKLTANAPAENLAYDIGL